jgi:hypothetical protein
MAKWRNRPDPAGIPDWVRHAWVYGDSEARQLADLWLDDLYVQNFAAWEVAFVEFLSTPGYS